MKPFTVVYVGRGMSGRQTSLDSVVRAALGSSGVCVRDPYRTYSFVVDGRRIEGTISYERSRVAYDSLSEMLANAVVQSEVDLLAKADCIMFVLDSQRARQAVNRDELDKLRQDLTHRGVDLDTRAVVFQANKRDLPDILPMDELRSLYQSGRSVFVESIASRDVGTVDALRAGLALSERAVHL